MAALADIVLAPAKKDALMAECVGLAEDQVASRGGLRGLTVRAGLKMIKAARPDIMQRAVNRLLPEFLAALEPLYQEYASSVARQGQDFAAFLGGRPQAAVAALLGVADARVALNPNAAVKSIYARLRGGAEHEVGAALPRFAELLSRYLAS